MKITIWKCKWCGKIIPRGSVDAFTILICCLDPDKDKDDPVTGIYSSCELQDEFEIDDNIILDIWKEHKST